MGTKQSTKNKKTVCYDYVPKDLMSSSFSEGKIEKSPSNTMHIYERVRGRSFIVTYESERGVYVYSPDNLDEIVENFNNNAAKSFAKVRDYLCNQDFAIYGEYITPELSKTPYSGEGKIYFYDIFVNDNWIRNDDFVEMAESFNLPIAPVVSTVSSGLLTEKYLKKMLDNKSSVPNNKDIYGFYIKSLLEFGSHRNVNKGAFDFENPKYSQNKKKDKSAKKKDEKIKNDVVELARYTITEKVVSDWKKKLKKEKIDISKNNLDKILPPLVDDYLFNFSEDVLILAQEENIEVDEACDKIKKFIPRVIINKLFN